MTSTKISPRKTRMFLIVLFLAITAVFGHAWERSGCHRVELILPNRTSCFWIKVPSVNLFFYPDIFSITMFDSVFFGSSSNVGKKKGIYLRLLGHTRKIRIPGCVVFDITTNACRGFCSSYSTPSPNWILESNNKQGVWSIGQCCNIMETEDVLVEVMCIGGMKHLTFKSAKTCSCYHCKKE